MKRLLLFSFICFLSGAMLIGCQRDRGVEAGNEPGRTDTYQPRPAPSGEVPPSLSTPESSTQTGTQPRMGNQEVRGQLTRVDISNKTITVRAENGMEQTFKWNDQSNLQGIESRNNTQRPTTSGNQMSDLKGKEGSEVSVMWRDDNGAKVATSINVTDQSSGSKNSSNGNTNNWKSNTNNTNSNSKGGAKGTY